MRRPFGISALSAFSFAGAFVAVVAALSLAFPGGPFEPMWQLNPRGHQGLSDMRGWGVLLLAVVSGACGITGMGLWQLRRWGYVLAVAGLSIHLVGDIVNVVLGIEPRAIIGVPIVTALLVYLSRPSVRGAFERIRARGQLRSGSMNAQADLDAEHPKVAVDLPLRRCRGGDGCERRWDASER